MVRITLGLWRSPCTCPALTHQSPALKGKFQVLEEAIGRAPGVAELQDNGACGDRLVESLGLGEVPAAKAKHLSNKL